jgi:hypothetical protein
MSQPGPSQEVETEMTDVRRIVFSLVVLAAFLLVLAAPFRWMF